MAFCWISPSPRCFGPSSICHHLSLVTWFHRCRLCVFLLTSTKIIISSVLCSPRHYILLHVITNKYDVCFVALRSTPELCVQFCSVLFSSLHFTLLGSLFFSFRFLFFSSHFVSYRLFFCMPYYCSMMNMGCNHFVLPIFVRFCSTNNTAITFHFYF